MHLFGLGIYSSECFICTVSPNLPFRVGFRTSLNASCMPQADSSRLDTLIEWSGRSYMVRSGAVTGRGLTYLAADMVTRWPERGSSCFSVL